MNNTITIFKGQGFTMRSFIENGEYWFVAKDIAEALEYPQHSIQQMINLLRGIPENWKGLKRIKTLGGLQDLWCLKESGLYFFIGRSNKPKALPFQQWVYGEVLPDIRKHGMYISEALMDQLVSNPLVFEQVCTSYIENKLPSSDKTSLMVLGYSVHLGRTLFVVKEAANILRQFGLQIGEYQLWRMLREDGFASRHMCHRRSIIDLNRR